MVEPGLRLGDGMGKWCPGPGLVAGQPAGYLRKSNPRCIAEETKSKKLRASCLWRPCAGSFTSSITQPPSRAVGSLTEAFVGARRRHKSPRGWRLFASPRTSSPSSQALSRPAPGLMHGRTRLAGLAPASSPVFADLQCHCAPRGSAPFRVPPHGDCVGCPRGVLQGTNVYSNGWTTTDLTFSRSSEAALLAAGCTIKRRDAPDLLIGVLSETLILPPCEMMPSGTQHTLHTSCVSEPPGIN